MFKRYVFILAVVSAIGTASLEARERWIDQHDAQFGFSYSFPESLFSSAEGDGKPGFHYFAAKPVDAKFFVGAWDNRDDATPEHFKRWMITNAGGYEEVTYQPRGRSWFVLSGYRGEQIYYEKGDVLLRWSDCEHPGHRLSHRSAGAFRSHRGADGKHLQTKPRVHTPVTCGVSLIQIQGA